MKRSDVAILTVAVSLVTGFAGFGLGRVSAGKAPATAAAGGSGGTGAAGGGSGFGGGAGGGARRFGGRPVFGTVASLSGSTLTITDSSGAPHTVTLTATTTYTAGAGTAATQADLTTGVSVAAFGQAASDGTVTATRVIINPTMPSGGGGFGGSSSGGNSQLN